MTSGVLYWCGYWCVGYYCIELRAWLLRQEYIHGYKFIYYYHREWLDAI